MEQVQLIEQIIKSDDIEKLQEISANDFDFNQKLDKFFDNDFYSLNKTPSLIDCAAFYGSINCFKYLLLNNADVIDTGAYAVVGGNFEIIHLCEQNNASFKDACIIAIRYHRNDIFRYLYENNKIDITTEKKHGRIYTFINRTKIKNNQPDDSQNDENKILKTISTFAINSIDENNFEIFLFLLQNGLEIKFDIMSKLFENGNFLSLNIYIYIFLSLKHVFKKTIPKESLPYSIVANNFELVEHILSYKDIDVNMKNVILIQLKKLFLIFKFFKFF